MASTLTAAEKALVRSSFGEFAKTPKISMVPFLQALISNNPEYYNYFEKLQGIEVADFAKSTYAFNCQGPKMGVAIFDLVCELDNEEELVKKIDCLVTAPQHTRIHLQKDDYRNGFNALLAALKIRLGEGFTWEIERAWVKTANVLVEIIGQCLQPTHEDRRRVRASLGEFMKDSESSMAVFYQILIGDHPEYQHHFQNLANVETCDIKRNNYIRKTIGPKIGAAIVDLINISHDVEVLHHAVNRLVYAKQHIRIHLIKDDYEIAFHTLLKAMHRVLGDRFNKADKDAWSKVLNIILNVIAQELAMTNTEIATIRLGLDEFVKDRSGMTDFYQALLTNNPQYVKHFAAQLGNYTVDTIGKSAFFRNVQGPKIAALLVEVVSKIDNQAGLRKAVHDVVFAPQHVRLRLRKDDYNNAFDALVFAIKRSMGSRFIDADQKAWDKAIDLILSQFAKELAVTLDEKAAVRATLGEFIKDPRGSMTAFYQALFTANPEYQGHFSHLHGVSVADLSENTYLMDQQGPRIDAGIFELICMMDDKASFQKAINKLVTSPHHVQIGLKRQDYERAFKALVQAIKTRLGDLFQDSDEDAWLKVVDVILAAIGKALNH